MGEIADAMLAGEFCQQCGEYLGEGDGFPRSCLGCISEDEPTSAKQDARKAKRRQRRSGAGTSPC